MSERWLILGGQGMLGHTLWRTALANGRSVWATVRRPDGVLMDRSRAVSLDIDDFAAVERALAEIQPQVVVNCIGIVKQLPGGKAAIPSLSINALLPHRLAAACAAIGARLIHVSTDCVFSGRRGHYKESDVPDAEDLYGRSKLLGEVNAPALTLRTSIVGRELSGAHGLIEWFLGQSGPVNGFRHAVFSGVSTQVLSALILDAVRFPALAGLYQVAAAPIDKYSLLKMTAASFGRSVEIVPVDEPGIDRSLDGSRFCAATGWVAPSWTDMMQSMAADQAAYINWRNGEA